MDINMNFEVEANRIFALDVAGNLIAEVTFPNVSESVVDLNHTFVDPSLRGQGVAGQLMAAAVKALQARGLKVRPTCSYAVQWFAKHPAYQSLMEESGEEAREV